MFRFLSKESFMKAIAEMVADKVAQEVNTSLAKKNDAQDKKLNMVIEHLEKLRFELSSLDQRLTSKELKDKTEYGHMQYKLSSLQNDLRNNSTD